MLFKGRLRLKRHAIVEMKLGQERRLFDAFIVVSPTFDKDLSAWQLKLDQCLPSTARVNLPKQIELFCFPDINEINRRKVDLRCSLRKAEEFTFVLTQSSGHRTFGFCRRILQTTKFEDSRYDIRPRIPQTICFLSSYPYFSIFHMLLKTVQIRRWLTPSAVAPLLRDLYNKDMPSPATPFYLQRMVLIRPIEERLPPMPKCINTLLSRFSAKLLRYVISAILCERRVIFLSNSLEILSNCIHGLLSLCYPFVWTHILVPYLPSQLLDYVCAPSPYLIGLSRDHANTIEQMPVGELYIVDVETGNIRATHNAPDIIPIGGDVVASNEFQVRRSSSGMSPSQHFVRELESIYSKYSEFQSDLDMNNGNAQFDSTGFAGRSTSKQSGGRNSSISLSRHPQYGFDCTQISQCFLVYFLQVFASYKNFLGTALRDTRHYAFDKHAFLKSHVEDRCLSNFLGDFLGTNMFELFLQTRFEVDYHGSGDFKVHLNAYDNHVSSIDKSPSKRNQQTSSQVDNGTKGFFDKQVHIVQLKHGDCSYQSIKKSVQAMVAVELNANSFTGGKNRVTSDKLRDMLMDTTSNKISKYSKDFAYKYFINASFEPNCQPIIMEVIFKRLIHSQGKDWRHGYKALCLLECLLQQASEAMIADTLNVSALLYTLMGYRANEKKDAVMLRALNVMSIYDGGNKGRGEKIRTQASFTYKIANDCHFMRSIRQRFSKSRYSGRLQSDINITRCDSIRVYTLKNGNYNDTSEAMYRSTGSMADKIKFGVKFGVKAVKHKVNHLKGKSMKIELHKRVIIRAPSFKNIHEYFTTEMSKTYASSLPVFLPRVKNQDSESSHTTLIDIHEKTNATDIK